jgi:superfamily II DNA/RNA helicase
LARAESKVKENLNDVSASVSLALDVPQSALPEPFAGWVRARGWHPGMPISSNCSQRSPNAATRFTLRPPAEARRSTTLDLGIDLGDVDLVINVGAPKGASRLAQRIGRANHRLDQPSKALLVPASRFEVVECQAALEAAEEGAQDTPPSRQVHSTYSPSTYSALPAPVPSTLISSIARWSARRPIGANPRRLRQGGGSS